MPRNKRLKDEMAFQAGPGYSPTTFIVAELPSRPDAIQIILDGPSEVETKVSPARAKASDIGKLRAKKFVELLRLGRRPSEAAHALHTTVQEMMMHSDVQKQVKDLVDEFSFDAQQRKALVRAGANKIALTNLKDGGDPKLALEALKLIGDDHEVAIKGQAGQQQIQVDVVLKNLVSTPVELPGIPSQLPAGDPSILDAELVEEGK